jgi:hydrogenase expression/formation protein HypC
MPGCGVSPPNPFFFTRPCGPRGEKLLVCQKKEQENKRMCLGIPGQVKAINKNEIDIAQVEISGVRRAINIALLREEGIEPGDWVLIHVGFAMSKIDEEEALETLKALRELGTMYSDEVEMITRNSKETIL